MKVLQGGIATKDDLDNLEQRSSSYLDNLEQRSNSRLDNLELRTGSRLDTLELRLNGRMDRLEGRIERLENKVNLILGVAVLAVLAPALTRLLVGP